jgi:glycosyltransferase involved in cell wall biosynthesis
MGKSKDLPIFLFIILNSCKHSAVLFALDTSKLNDLNIPKISIVIPSLNQGKYIERALLSIINQNYQNTEIIIIDGGSDDDTLSIIQKYEAHIAWWISETDSGQANALNKGFKKATGEIYGWLNSSDAYLPGAFWEVSHIFANHPNIMVCYGNSYTIDELDNIISRHYALKSRKPRAAYENMDVYNQCFFWRKDVHDRFGAFDENLRLKIDVDMIIAFLINEKKEKFYKTEAFLGAFRNHHGQKTYIEKMCEADFLEYSYIDKKYGFYPSESFIGKYYRLKYRFAQLFESLVYGGILYTWHKFMTTYKRRGRFL